MAQVGSRIFKTVILQPGETFTLPPDGEIVFTSDGTSLDSECEVPATENYSCYRLSFGISDTSGTDAALEDEASPNPIIEYIEISGTQYAVDYNLSAAQITPMRTAIEGAVPTAIFKIYSIYKNNFSRRKEFGIKFRTFPSLAADMIMKITGLSYTDGLYLVPLLDSDCNCYSSVDDLYCNNSNT